MDREMDPNRHRRLREWFMWRFYFLGCKASFGGHESLATALWRIKDLFARGRAHVSVIAILARDYAEDADVWLKRP